MTQEKNKAIHQFCGCQALTLMYPPAIYLYLLALHTLLYLVKTVLLGLIQNIIY